MPLNAAPKTHVRLSVELTDKTGRERHMLLPERRFTRSQGRQPLFVGLLELPPTKEPRVSFLNIRWQGTAALHLVALAVDRP